MIDPTRDDFFFVQLDVRDVGVMEDVFPPVHVRAAAAWIPKSVKSTPPGAITWGIPALQAASSRLRAPAGKASGNISATISWRVRSITALMVPACNQFFHGRAACPGRMETDHLVARLLKQPRRLGHPVGHSHLRQADDQLVAGAIAADRRAWPSRRWRQPHSPESCGSAR